MPANEVMGMLSQTLQTMATGIPGVFAVLAVFYVTLKLLMVKSKDKE